MNIRNHRLADAAYVRTPNRGGALEPDTIVIHYTAGPSAESAVQALTNPDHKASAHIVVDTDGSLTQLVPFNVVAWHAGKSRHLDRSGLNSVSIGIEIVNAGRLSRSGSTFFSWFNKEYPVEAVMKAVHRNEQEPTYWHRYTEAQVAATAALCEALVKKYGIRYILGHEEISPGRKIDPGPAFPLDKLRNRILAGDARSESGDPAPAETPVAGVVTASKLNIRSGPSTAQAAIARPLPNGTPVRILEKTGGWYKVSVNVEGWVSADYIEETGG